MGKTIDNRGLPCPQPVLNTRKALEDIKGSGDVLVSIVDNEGAKENILRFLNSAGNWAAEVEKKGDGIYIQIKPSASPAGMQQGTSSEGKEEPFNCSVGREGHAPIFLITRSTLGSGSEELGKILMRSFVATIKEGPVLPEKMLFLNSGAYLTVSGSPVLDDLLELEKLGVEIFSCGTCLDYFQLKEKLAVGSVTNMFATVESLLTCSGCVTI